MSVHRAKHRNGRGPAKAVAFYDLDGTLAELNLVNAAVYLLANLGEWSGRLRYLAGFAARIPTLYRAEQRDRLLLNVVLFEIFKGACVPANAGFDSSAKMCLKKYRKRFRAAARVLRRPAEEIRGAGCDELTPPDAEGSLLLRCRNPACAAAALTTTEPGSMVPTASLSLPSTETVTA